MSEIALYRNDPDIRENSEYREFTEERVAQWTTGSSPEAVISDAVAYLDEITERGRQILKLLLGNPNYMAASNEVLAVLHIPSTKELSGVTQTFHAAYKRTGRYRPFDLTPVAGSKSMYFIPHEIALVLKLAFQRRITTAKSDEPSGFSADREHS